MIKKTVYLPVDKNNDLEIEINKVYRETGSLSAVGIAEKAYSLGIGQFKKKELYTFTEEELNQYTESIIKQALEIAAENVMIVAESEIGIQTIKKEIDINKHDNLKCNYCFYPYKNSITNVFEKVYKNFKV